MAKVKWIPSIDALALTLPLEVLRQPLQTSVSVDASDFEEFKAQEKLHIIISVRDFKAVVVHADSLKVAMTCSFSTPARPMLLSYGVSGIRCEFTLVTTGDQRTAPAAGAGNTSVSRGPSTIQPAPSVQGESRSSVGGMAPPQWPKTRTSRRLKPPGSAKQSYAEGQRRAESDSLFVPLEDDRQWDPQFREGDEQGVLGWNASADNVSPAETTSRHPCSRDHHRTGSGTKHSETAARSRRRSRLLTKRKALRRLKESLRYSGSSLYRMKGLR